MLLYIRTCQSCGKAQSTKPVNEYKGTSWTELKCTACKSPDLDYGSFRDVDPKTLKRIEDERA
jgi:hypothetical protein